MNDSSCENLPWLLQKTEDGQPTVTATVIEGAEVVRTAAVSYATPILHQVFIQGSPCPRDENVVSAVSASGTDIKAFRVSIAKPSSAQPNGLLLKGDDGVEKDLKTHPSVSSPSSSIPLLVFPSSLLPSTSVVLKSVTAPSKEGFLPHVSSSSFVSSISSTSPPSLTPFPSLNGTIRTDDELTPLTWLQDSNLLMGTALSPMKHPPLPSTSFESLVTSTPPESIRVSRATSSGPRKGVPPTTDTSGKFESVRGDVLASEAVNVVEYKVESPTSDYAEDNPSELSGDVSEAGEISLLPKTSGCSGSATNCFSSSKIQRPISYNPKEHTEVKPPFSFSCLIFMAIEESVTKALPVKDIYSWIINHYPYYKDAPTGWKNSVRHNLSLNKCFCKVEKSSTLGKGSLWMVDPFFRPNLIQAMSKTPFVPQSQADKSILMNTKTLINNKFVYGLTNKTPEKIVTLGSFVLQNEVDLLPSSAVLSTTTSSIDRQRLEDTSSSTVLYVPTKPDNELGQHSATSKLVQEQNYKQSIGSEPGGTRTNNTFGKLPRNGASLYTLNPELFPRLAKRLENHSLEMETPSVPLQSSPIPYPPPGLEVHREDVDAAAAMLVLKHGPRMLGPYHENFANLGANIEGVSEVCLMRSHNSSESSDPGSVVISSSPSFDHAYIQHNGCSRSITSLPDRRKLTGKRTKTSPASSVDEAFFDDSYESPVWESPVTSSHSPHLYEEADALLNLAAVATSLASRQELEDAMNTTPSRSHHPKHSPESQYTSYSETQITCNSVSSNNRISDSNDPNEHLNIRSNQAYTVNQSTNNLKTTKRKIKNETLGKLSSNKKPASLGCSRSSADSFNKSSASKALYNNNSKATVNRNKLSKIKKLLKVSRC